MLNFLVLTASRIVQLLLILIICRLLHLRFLNNKKLLGRVRAFDRHCNMVLENVTEMWTEVHDTLF
jgi:small nuclear ribonucleoprotein D2